MTSLHRACPHFAPKRLGLVWRRRDRVSILFKALGSSRGHCFSGSREGCFDSSGRSSLKLQRHNWTLRSFSVSGGGSHDDVVDQAVVTEDNTLELASHKARTLFDLATHATSSDSAKTSSPQDVTDAIDAARALLAITYPTTPFVKAMNKEDPELAKHLSSLHRALLGVTSWCLSLLPADSSLLTWSLDVSRRAGELSLPLHLPLYQELAVSVANYAEGSSCAAIILEVSRLANDMLKVPIDSSFFGEPLAQLIRRKQLRCAITLLKEIRVQHSISSLDDDTTIKILDILKNDDDNVEEDADAMELFLILNKSIVRDFPISNNPKSPCGGLESMEDAVGSLIDAEQRMDELVELVGRLTDEDDEDGRLADMMESILSGAGTKNDLQAAVEELIDAVKGRASTRSSSAVSQANVVKGVAKVNPSDGSWDRVKYSEIDSGEESASESSDDEVHDLAKDMIYTRDSSFWRLPDVTEQLIRLNDGRDMLYSPMYEEKILRCMSEEEIDDFDG